jgi:arabinofuranosyltransferase
MLAFGIVRTAWIGDDAYITFRSIENWCQGYGLRWNVADRVQTFTCPLWMLCCAAGRALTGELFGTTLILSGCATVGAFVGLWRLAGAGASALLALALVALSSRCFVDYSTSGLENPLSHLLLVLFAWTWVREQPLERRVLHLGLLGGLLATTRMDLSLLAAPAVAVASYRLGLRRALPRLAIAAAPFGCWLAFAVFYYGTPFPSTAYSKLFAVGLPFWELALQGVRYFTVLGWRDPASALVLALGIGLTLRGAWRSLLPLSLGIVLYLAYIVRIGGDFMAGRFFSSSWVLALAILAVRSRCCGGEAESGRPDRRPWVGLGFLAVACAAGLPPAFVGSGRAEDAFVEWRIHDVRQQGWPACGLMSPNRRPVLANSVTAVLRQMQQDQPAYEVHGVVGERGYQGGPLLHIIDPWLCDPVLCRLPTVVREDWQISHFTRRVPEGYLELLSRGDDRFCNPHFARFARAVLSVTRGELWSWARIGAAFDLARGALDDDLRAYLASDYFAPPMQKVALSELPKPVPPDTWWFRCGARVLYEGGLEVDFGGEQRGLALELELGPASVYRLEFRSGDRELHTHNVQTDTQGEYGGMRPYRVELPPAAQGFTHLRIRPGYRGAVMAVGAARLLL